MIPKDKKVFIMMPAFNEEDIIESVISDIKKKIINLNYKILI